MAGVNTSAMKPANGGAAPPPVATGATAGTPDPAAKTPTPRKPRRKRTTKPTERKEPTEEQFATLGKLTFDAAQAGMTIDEYIDAMRATVEAYDAVFGQ